MLRIKIELVPYGIRPPVEIGRMIIANDGTSDSENIGHYDVWVGKRGDDDDDLVHDKPVRTGRVEKHARISKSVWVLIKKALDAAGY